MQAGNPSDEELWEACRRLPSDWEPLGQRNWHGRTEDRPDCDSCKWFTELFRTAPDWGVCCNTESPRSGLLTHREQGCWQHEPEMDRHYQAVRPARCDFMRGFEAFLREQTADFIKREVCRANDPFPGDEPPTLAPQDVGETPLFFVVRRLLKHADEDFHRSAFDRMVARARKDTKRCWDAARRFWAGDTGVAMSAIRLPENIREMENEFWRRVDAAISKAFEGRTASPEKREAVCRLTARQKRRSVTH